MRSCSARIAASNAPMSHSRRSDVRVLSPEATKDLRRRRACLFHRRRDWRGIALPLCRAAAPSGCLRAPGTSGEDIRACRIGLVVPGGIACRPIAQESHLDRLPWVIHRVEHTFARTPGTLEVPRFGPVRARLPIRTCVPRQPGSSIKRPMERNQSRLERSTATLSLIFPLVKSRITFCDLE